MKGLILRIIAAVSLLLWAIDMVFPWQQIMLSEENRYTAIQKRGKLVVGTINNSISYFIGTEGATGLEYELSGAFAKYLGVELEIVSMNSNDELFDALDKNKIDIAAANLLYQPKRAEQFQIGPAYYSASWQVVYRKGENRPRTLKEIEGKLAITAGSEMVDLLTSQKEKAPNLKWRVEDRANQEELLLQVADGTIDYTIANSIDVSAAQQIKPNIAVAFDVTDESSIHWYLSSNTYSELQAALLDFMNESINNGLIAKIEEKYFNHFADFDYVDMRSYLKAVDKLLPKYQKLFEKYKGDLDWRVLAAVAYQESHWDENATSPTGVRGMMMLTKATAERMNISDRTNAAQSIKAGSEYLHLLIKQMPETIPQEDRIWFALAAYNMGLGHVLDVRRLTKSLGGDPDNWLDVKKNLPLLAEKRYHSKLKYGYARGYEAFQYVENIRRYLNSILNYHRVQENQVAKEQELKAQAAQLEQKVNVEKENSAEIQNTEKPEVDVKQTETPKVEETKQTETPKVEETKQTETPKVEETKQTETPKVEETKQTEIPQVGETKQTETPQVGETKQTEIPQVGETKQTEKPRVEEAKQAETPRVEEAKQAETPRVEEAKKAGTSQAEEVKSVEMPKVEEIKQNGNH